MKDNQELQAQNYQVLMRLLKVTKQQMGEGGDLFGEAPPVIEAPFGKQWVSFRHQMNYFKGGHAVTGQWRLALDPSTDLSAEAWRRSCLSFRLEHTDERAVCVGMETPERGVLIERTEWEGEDCEVLDGMLEAWLMSILINVIDYDRGLKRLAKKMVKK